MTLAELKTLLATTTLPVVYRAWETDEPSLPYIVFIATGSDNFAADNRVYHKRTPVDVELYTRDKSPDTEATVEAVLDSVPLVWTKSETYLEDEKCFEIIYGIEV